MVDYGDDARYEVIPLPKENLDDSPRTIQTDPNIITNPAPAIVPSPFGWHDTNGDAARETSDQNDAPGKALLEVLKTISPKELGGED